MRIIYAEDVKLIWDTAKSVQVLKTCAALSRNHVNLKLLALKGRGSREDIFGHYGIQDRFPISLLPTIDIRYLSSFWFRGIFGLYLAITRPEVVYTRDLGIAFIANFLHLNFIYEIHSMPVRTQQNWLLKKIMRSKHQIATISITSAIKKQLHHEFGTVPANKIIVIPCSADLRTQKDGEPKVFQGNSRKPQVAYIGHLYPGKGGEMIVEIANKCPQFSFQIVGSHTPELFAGRKIPKNMVFHGSRSHAEAMEILDQCDFAIAPYQKKTQAVDGKIISDWFSPLKVFEYLGAGTPIVCSNIPVIHEVLSHEHSALFVDPENVNEWVEALTRLKEDHSLALKLSRNGRDLISNRYSYDIRAKNILTAINSSV